MVVTSLHPKMPQRDITQSSYELILREQQYVNRTAVNKTCNSYCCQLLERNNGDILTCNNLCISLFKLETRTEYV